MGPRPQGWGLLLSGHSRRREDSPAIVRAARSMGDSPTPAAGHRGHRVGERSRSQALRRGPLAISQGGARTLVIPVDWGPSRALGHAPRVRQPSCSGWKAGSPALSTCWHPSTQRTHSPGAPMSRPARNRGLPAQRSPRSLRASASAPAVRSREESRSTRGVLPIGTMPAEVARQAQREMDRLRRLPAGLARGRAGARVPPVAVVAAVGRRGPRGRRPQAGARTCSSSEHLGLAQGQGAHRRVPRGAPAQARPARPRAVPGGPAGHRQVVARRRGGARAAPAVRAHQRLRHQRRRRSCAGTSRTLPGAQPGKIVRALRDAGARNPVLMIDGVDRLAGEGGLGVIEVLLELLDPEIVRALHRSLPRPADRSLARGAAAVREQSRPGARTRCRSASR